MNELINKYVFEIISKVALFQVHVNIFPLILLLKETEIISEARVLTV